MISKDPFPVTKLCYVTPNTQVRVTDDRETAGGQQLGTRFQHVALKESQISHQIRTAEFDSLENANSPTTHVVIEGGTAKITDAWHRFDFE